MGKRITRLAVAVLLAVLMSICGQLERYTLEVIATDRTIIRVIERSEDR